MKCSAVKLGVMLLWVALGIAAATLYGILNDQITVSLSPEYFSVFKREQFADVLRGAGLQNAPARVQAIFVGALATWWFGLFLGIVLSISSMVGRHPALPTRLYMRAVGGVVLYALCLSVVCSGIGYLAEPFVRPTVENWPFLERINDVRRAFAVGFWHDGAYLGGFVGTFISGLWAQRKRRVKSDHRVISGADTVM